MLTIGHKSHLFGSLPEEECRQLLLYAQKYYLDVVLQVQPVDDANFYVELVTTSVMKKEVLREYHCQLKGFVDGLRVGRLAQTK